MSYIIYCLDTFNKMSDVFLSRLCDDNVITFILKWSPLSLFRKKSSNILEIIIKQRGLITVHDVMIYIYDVII